MNRIYEESLLFDFYGELLTEVQKEVFEEVVLNDYSLGEVASDRGISRQGVHDMVRRTRSILKDYEEKLGLVEKFLKIKENAELIQNLTADAKIKELAGEIIEEL